jgi:hypothetical protein
MNTKKLAKATKRWTREWPERTGPQRGAAGFYRTAQDAAAGVGGVPLGTANDAVVAAVRLAYKVAEAQIERSARLAQRLRTAGDRAVGPGSERLALDATEKLVMDAMMAGLAWWEGSVAEGRCPVKRLVAAEYEMMGNVLGLSKRAKPDTAASVSAGKAASAPEPEATPRRGNAPSTPAIQVVHRGDRKDFRPVMVRVWELATRDEFSTQLYFFNVADSTMEPLEAELVVSGKGTPARLIMATPRASPSGQWRAAICDGDSVQVGFVEIVL